MMSNIVFLEVSMRLKILFVEFQEHKLREACKDLLEVYMASMTRIQVNMRAVGLLASREGNTCYISLPDRTTTGR